MDDILEFILEIILDGAIEVVGSKSVPMPIRILLGSVILVLFLGIFGLLIYVGIKNDSVVLTILGAGLGVGFACMMGYKIKKHNRKGQ